MTDFEDSYITISKPLIHEIKIKGSRFIASVNAVLTGKDVKQHLDTVNNTHPQASHHCYAYRIGLNQDSFRYSDDGEPSGTAGKPILDAIKGRELTNTLCIVTRYFGGTKLGTGGLIRAYGQCAAEALDLSGSSRKFIETQLLAEFPYSLTGNVMRILSQSDCEIINTSYGEKTSLTLQMRVSRSEEFKETLVEATAGQIRICEAPGANGT